MTGGAEGGTHMRIRFKSLIAVFLTGLFLSVPSYGEGFNKADIDGFIDELVRDEGFSRPVLEKMFNDVEYKSRIVEIMQRPAEKRLTWAEYKNLLINDKRINDGVEFWRAHRKTLEKASSEYGVSTSVIIGILGIETGFGQNSGGFRVVDALATLGFKYPRRATFFRKELKEFLILAREQGFDPLTLTGSYAGAMGIPQFMPSSYREYAIDFDKDGQADIWESPADAIGSIASYLSRHGWQKGKPVAAKASVQGQKYAKAIDKNPRPTHSVNEVKNLGWRTTRVLSDTARVRGLKLEGRSGTEHWLTLTNFYVITRYNKSDLYAMAVYQLGDMIEKKMKSQDKKSLAKS
ncbi:lytic murein transglycosylase B [Sansalvadorimonas sp. 2012CJ34-2]|uniref:Lytic murein transglycosylase B n=1 Tax=Parendozoicomonas callyspongiae TaxID=2942213 RepID=A0ABT0PCR4_9GAMM|nr:lytic murein transglycosylase B [Sansalvadorimonas sp. 2012CJ34-2]MCL6269125.1 lytic murein transglycosylase B [Sansalvadorimonas sp. 2012CJ34-2]